MSRCVTMCGVWLYVMMCDYVSRYEAVCGVCLCVPVRACARHCVVVWF